MTPAGAIRLETLAGAAIMAVVPDLARLRVAVFRDWPYLYDGDDAYQAESVARPRSNRLGTEYGETTQSSVAGRVSVDQSVTASPFLVAIIVALKVARLASWLRLGRSHANAPRMRALRPHIADIGKGL